jgi:hypothetical protein
MKQGWRWATRLSTFGWIIKTGIGMANLITFGALTRNTSGYAYLQGMALLDHCRLNRSYLSSFLQVSGVQSYL